jgi:hypothetical protein
MNMNMFINMIKYRLHEHVQYMCMFMEVHVHVHGGTCACSWRYMCMFMEVHVHVHVFTCTGTCQYLHVRQLEHELYKRQELVHEHDLHEHH